MSWGRDGCEPGVSRRQCLEAGTCNHEKLGPDLVNEIAHLFGLVEAYRIETAAGDTAEEEGRDAGTAAAEEEGDVAAGLESWTVLASEERNVSSRFLVAVISMFASNVPAQARRI